MKFISPFVLFFLVIVAALMGSQTSEATPLSQADSAKLKESFENKLGSPDVKTILNDIDKGVEFAKKSIKIIEDAYV
ncbi:hypothetical protein TYRP_015403 [Tyrophagus putrescentiae]|nr:hypothetical protein TYRP_015403 [Tyrophagus putrescentiae]